MMDLQSSLSSSDFKDLYLSNSFADVTGLVGVSDTRVPVPESWSDDIRAVLNLCREMQAESRVPEFSISYQQVVYRVTHMDSVEPGGTYVLRQSKASIRSFRALGIPSHFADAMLDVNAVGLVLICGAFGVGKTSTGASWVVERHKLHGGVSLAIEDPVETLINGEHGKGRCIAINASRHHGGYKEHLLRGLRSGVDFIFLGEIRDSETAYEALKAGSNGELIAATFHALGIPEALERLVTLAGQHTQSAAKLLADSLLGAMWQNLTPVTKDDGSIFNRFSVQTLLVIGNDSVREKIRNGRMSTLHQDVEQQGRRSVWRSET